MSGAEVSSGAPARTVPVSTLRRVVVGIIVVSFAVAALGGIAVLIGADLGPEAARVLGTTAVVGSFSIAVLCCAALADRRLRTFGTVGAVVSILTAALVVFAIWWSPDVSASGAFWRMLWTGVAATSAFALASLLLLLADRRRPAVRGGLWVTLGLFGVVLAMVLFLIWFPDAVDSPVFPRALGIAAILAALGAVVVPVMSLLLPDSGRAPHDHATAGVSADLIARLAAEASRRGITVEQLVAPVFEHPPPGPTA